MGAKMCALQAIILASTIVQIQAQEESITNINSIEITEASPKNPFMNYMKKYDVVNVTENIHNQLKNGNLNMSKEEIFNLIFDKIDCTSDLLNVKVKNGKSVALLPSEGRRQFKPPRFVSDMRHDQYNIRNRFYELMKQAIYQARNKMTIMQVMRKKYRSNTVYKMGYLMGKTDVACRVFLKSSKSFSDACGVAAHGLRTGIHLYEVLTMVERMLHQLVQVQLLRELIIQNDISLFKTIGKYHDKRMERWPFID